MTLSKLNALRGWVDAKHRLQADSTQTLGKQASTTANINGRDMTQGLFRVIVTKHLLLNQVASNKVDPHSIEL
jgi:hypothetical protein